MLPDVEVLGIQVTAHTYVFDVRLRRTVLLPTGMLCVIRLPVDTGRELWTVVDPAVIDVVRGVDWLHIDDWTPLFTGKIPPRLPLAADVLEGRVPLDWAVALTTGEDS